MKKGKENVGINRQKGFTLTELLLVIALIGMLLATTLPALHTLTGSHQLDAAANALHTSLKTARQYALTHRQPTYLLFKDHISEADPDTAFKSFAIFTININGATITQKDGYFLQSWNTLPDGIVFDAECLGISNVFEVVSGRSWNGAIGQRNALKVGEHTYPVFGIYPSGNRAGDTTQIISICEGFYHPGTWRLQRTSRQNRSIRVEQSGHSTLQKRLYNNQGNPELPR
jgi:prepilin-type N-terminal cleavage/methylation domain-containing protein